MKQWESYELVALDLLCRFADQFGLGIVEGKQIIRGESGAEWEIDAKGVRSNGEGFLVIECRRHTKSRLNQEQVAGVAYRIADVKADGGIIVSPLGFQAGAKKIAKHSGIVQVILKPESTITEYVLHFLNKFVSGLVAELRISGSLSAQKIGHVCNVGDHLACIDELCNCECHKRSARIISLDGD
jgi:hypothetical protein